VSVARTLNCWRGGGLGRGFTPDRVWGYKQGHGPKTVPYLFEYHTQKWWNGAVADG